MIDAHMVATLRRFPVMKYLEEINRSGRQAIEPDTRAQAAALYDFADQMLNFETSLNSHTRAVLNLVRDILYTEKFLLTNPKPRYVTYSNLGILNRFLLEGRAAPLKEKWSAAKRALALVVRDWHQWEQDRLSAYAAGTLDRDVIGFETPRASGDPVSHIKERERALNSLSQFSAVGGLPDTRLVFGEIRVHDTDWSFFAKDPARQVTHLTCLPRSRWHDEYMFLRMIHATECCYAGIMASLTALPGVVRSYNFLDATEILKGALYFSDFLTKLWEIFETMPIPHFFDGFREATGDASAIQSTRFQTLEVLTRGLGDAKRGALSHQKESRFAFNWVPPADATLPGMCRIAESRAEEGAEFLEIAAILDQHLYKWRARHYGIAKKYLPADAVGTGNEGVAYLAANFRTPLSAIGESEMADTTSEQEDNEPARTTLSFRLRPLGTPPVALVRGANISSAVVQSVVSSALSALQAVFPQRNEVIERNLAGYAQFFGNYDYPVAHQLASFRKKGKLPNGAIPALLLSTELKSGGLMGLHDGSRIAGQIIFDTASADESFEGIGKNLVKCTLGDPIVRDDKGIFASIFEGPDKRTAISSDGKESHPLWFFLIFGYPLMPQTDFDLLVQDGRSLLSSLEAEDIQVWSNNGR